MIKVTRNILLASAVIMAAAGCSKTPHEVTVTDSEIALKATEAGATKALLDKGTFAANGNRLQIYDFVDGAETPYIDDLIGPDVAGSPLAEATDGVWPFENGPHQWTPGTHKFFGWLHTDAKMDMTADEFFGKTLELKDGTQTLEIPSMTINQDTPQFDFMYSDIYTTEPTNTPVNLKFYHLFTALSIGVENSTSSFIEIEDFRIEGIPCTRSATIDFSGSGAAQVNYLAWTDATMSRSANAVPYEVSPKNLRSNIFNGSTTQEFMMLWPVEAEHLYSPDKSETVEGVVNYPESWKMYIKYTADGQTYEKRINFPNSSWEAGKKYHLTIVFADKMVELKVQVKEWEHEPQDIDYTNEIPSLSAGGGLTWDGNVSTVEADKQMVSIVNAQPAQAQFTLQTPVGGSWIVSLVGDVNAFEVSPSTGIIDAQTATIHVKPLVTSPTRDYKVQLKFTIRRSDGRMIAADNIIQTNGIYTIVLPRNN